VTQVIETKYNMVSF